MIETMAIYCLVIALLLLFANPFVHLNPCTSTGGRSRCRRSTSSSWSGCSRASCSGRSRPSSPQRQRRPQQAAGRRAKRKARQAADATAALATNATASPTSGQRIVARRARMPRSRTRHAAAATPPTRRRAAAGGRAPAIARHAAASARRWNAKPPTSRSTSPRRLLQRVPPRERAIAAFMDGRGRDTRALPQPARQRWQPTALEVSARSRRATGRNHADATSAPSSPRARRARLRITFRTDPGACRRTRTARRRPR